MKKSLKKFVSLLPKSKKLNIIRLVKRTNKLQGSAAEVGVYKGGSIALIAFHISDKTVYGFDTFEGLPTTKNIDRHHKGDFNNVSYKEVKGKLKAFKNIELIKGLFPQETSFFIKNKKFSLVHLDVDLYQSHLDSLEFFYPRMVKGGVIIIDDYEWHGCPGVTESTNEFFKNKPEKVQKKVQHQAFIVKKGDLK
jgi:hypothetical protein